MTVSIVGFAPEIAALIQQNALQRVFHEALYPRLLFRAEATPEEWQANVGETMIFTRSGRLPVNVRPLTPGTDPTPKAYATEQWKVTAAQYGDRVQTHMPTSRAMIASKFLLDTQKVGENAGATINQVTRDRLYNAYLSGDTVATALAGGGATTIHVASLNGFLDLVVGGQLVPVSPTNPIPVQLDTTNIANTVIASVPDVASEPLGPGTVTLGAALGAPLAARGRVRAVNRARIQRVGGGTTVDALLATSVLTVNDIIAGIQYLRSQNVPPHSDGRYHVHMPTEAVTQIFQDNHWQRLYQSIPEAAEYRDVMIGATLGSYFYQNTECPNSLNSGTLVSTSSASAVCSPEIGAEMANHAGVPIARTIITGGGAMYEKYIPEADYITAAGVNGKTGTFAVTSNGVIINTDRIRYILRAPQDALQQIVDQTWSYSGDWAVPSDLLTGNPARFKRAVVIEHAGQ